MISAIQQLGSNDVVDGLTWHLCLCRRRFVARGDRGNEVGIRLVLNGVHQRLGKDIITPVHAFGDLSGPPCTRTTPGRMHESYADHK